MWENFTDYELVSLATNYGIAEFVTFDDTFKLANRSDIERMLTEIEYDAAFGEEKLDFFNEVWYT